MRKRRSALLVSFCLLPILLEAVVPSGAEHSEARVPVSRKPSPLDSIDVRSRIDILLGPTAPAEDWRVHPVDYTQSSAPVGCVRLANGSLRVWGKDRRRVEVVRDMDQNPWRYLSTVKQMLDDAFRARQYWKVHRLATYLTVILDTPGARAELAGLCVDIGGLLHTLPTELREHDNGTLWAKRAGVVGWSDNLTLSQRVWLWGRWTKLQVEIFDRLSGWQWRGRRVRDAALAILERLPLDEAVALGETWPPKGFTGTRVAKLQRLRMDAALHYLSAAYRGDASIGERVAHLCCQPESALREYLAPGGGEDALGDQVGRTLILLSAGKHEP